MTGGRVIARNVGVQSSAEAISKVAALVLYAVMARSLGEEGFGEFSFAFSLGALLVVLAAPGVGDVVTRTIAREPRALGRLLWNALALRGAFGVAALAIVTAIAFAGDHSATTRATVVLLTLALLIEGMTKLVHAVFLGYDDSRPIAASLLIQRLFTATAGATVAAAGLGLVAISCVFLAGSVLGLGYALWRLRGSVGVPPRTFSASEARRLYSIAWPIGLSGIFTTILFRVDTLILAALDSKATVGLYGATYRLVDATLFLSFSVGSAMLPVLSRLGRDTRPSAADAFSSGAKVLVAILFPLGLGAALFAEPVLRLAYGEDFVAAATALRLLGGTIALYGISYLASITLVGQDRQRWIPWVSGVGALLNISLNLVLIPSMSLDGAALATTITEAARASALVYLVSRAAGRIDVARMLLGAVTGCVAMLGVRLATGEHLLAVVPAALAYVAVFVAYERLRHPDDVRLIVAVLTRRPPLSAADAAPTEP
jgi:O-antigen/teichoic acid export membrane protein